jgi:hypothetical protein
MRISRVRQLVRDHIDNYNRVVNLLEVHKDPDYMNASVSGSGEALLDWNPMWWHSRPRPVLEGTEIEKYAQAIYEINELLELESEGREHFIP